MRNLRSRILLPALMLAVTPAAAQPGDLWNAGPRSVDISVTGGLFVSTDWSQNVFLESFQSSGVTQRQTLLRGFSVAPGFGATAAVTYWEGRHGFRVYAGFTGTCVTTGNDCDDVVLLPDEVFPRRAPDMNQYTYGFQGIVGLVDWSRDQWWRPYFIVGAGGVTYDIDDDFALLLPGPITVSDPGVINGIDRIAVVDDPGTFLFAIDQVGIETKFAVNLGIGFDLRAPMRDRGIGFRFEASDQITQTPLSLTVTRLDGGVIDGHCCGFRNDISQVDINQRSVHNWRLSGGVLFEFGISRY